MLTRFVVPALRNSSLGCKQTFCKKGLAHIFFRIRTCGSADSKVLQVNWNEHLWETGGRVAPAPSVLPFRRLAGASLDFAAIPA